MEFFALLGIGLLIWVLITPWIAYWKANQALARFEQLQEQLDHQSERIDATLMEVAKLRQQIQGAPISVTSSVSSTRASGQKSAQTTGQVEPTVPTQDTAMDTERPDVGTAAIDTAAVATTPPTLDIDFAAARIAEEETAATSAAHTTVNIQSTEQAPPLSNAWTQATESQPSAFEVQLKIWLTNAKEWLFGGNLVAKVGLLILFIGVAFLLRLASNYVTVPIEFRLAGIAAGAIALLAWAWRIRESRRGIALPAQGAALAILMLVTFGAFKLFHVLPGGAAFLMLFILIAFTCLLAVLQDALWLAVFGIAGGFAAPILTSTGGGNHVALFSYYCLLNAGVLAIALKRSWRMLNLLGFAFTFIVGATWGEQRYVPDNYATSQAFLIIFWLFYIAIAVLFAWRRAPQLKSYVDGTLVFGVPMAGMALQYALVKDMRFGMAISALCVALTYASVATALWRWRRGNLRLLVESFLALAIVFGTLTIPLAFDGRWTSAIWAVEGAAIVWMGLRQKQALAWQFGVAVQLSSWVAFLSALTGLSPAAALGGNVGLGFLLLGVTGVLMALMFRRHVQQAQIDGQVEMDSERREQQRFGQRFGWMASSFISLAVVWLLLGMWVEVWLRLYGAQRASLLVATALALVFGLQRLGKQVTWHLPDVLGGAVAAIAGITFAALMYEHMDWRNFSVYSETTFSELLRNGPLMGGIMLCAGALVTAFAFKKRVADMLSEAAVRTTRITLVWFLVAVFWWCGFALHGLAHALAYLTATRDAGAVTPWYSISFWAAYGIGLSLSALAWTHLALRKQFPEQRWMLVVFWPALTALGGFAFYKQVAGNLGWVRQNWMHFSSNTIGEAWLTLLAGPLIGALILCGLTWHAAFKTREQSAVDIELGTVENKPLSIAVWLTGLGLIWYVLVIDSLSLFAHSTLQSIGMKLNYEHITLLLIVASGMSYLWFARNKRLSALRWLATPAAVLQALASVVLLGSLYIDRELPSVGTGITMLGCWLGMAWCLRYWQHSDWKTTQWGLRFVHFGRVIAPWLMIAPLIALMIDQWLTGDSAINTQTLADAGWVAAGMWPDYFAAWVSIASLFLLVRQVKTAGWPLRPLEAWYGTRLIPLATLWALLLVVYWNLRQNGSMLPLPYLPLLNPLDITSGFVALLVALVWQANKTLLTPVQRIAGIKVAVALAFGWFNLMLLRTAAQYLHLPYRFDSLYNSQFVQAMLSIVWTLSAFMLMRLAVRKLSKPLWMVGAVLLAIVVVKLFLIDLSNVGSVARIVSFMSVGGLMLIIGYLAPLPHAAATVQSDELSASSGQEAP